MLVAFTRNPPTRPLSVPAPFPQCLLWTHTSSHEYFNTSQAFRSIWATLKPYWFSEVWLTRVIKYFSTYETWVKEALLALQLLPDIFVFFLFLLPYSFCWLSFPVSPQQRPLCPSLFSFPSHPPHLQPWDGDLWLSNKSWSSRHYFPTGSTSGQREKRLREHGEPWARFGPHPSRFSARTLPAFLLSLWFIYHRADSSLLRASLKM